MTYIVGRCPLCSGVFGFPEGVKRPLCRRCNSNVDARRVTILVRVQTTGELREAVSRFNSLTEGGQPRAHDRMVHLWDLTDVSPAPSTSPDLSSTTEKAAARASTFRNHLDRLREIARVLLEEQPEFTYAELMEAMEMANVREELRHRAVELLIHEDLVYEVRPGVFRRL